MPREGFYERPRSEEEQLLRELQLTVPEQEREWEIARQDLISFVEHLKRLRWARKRMERLFQDYPQARSFERNIEHMPADTEREWEHIPCDDLFSLVEDSTHPLVEHLFELIRKVFSRQGEACVWLMSPNSLLGYLPPSALIFTDRLTMVIVALELHQLGDRLKL